MLTLPDAIVVVFVPFATLFSSPTWRKAQVLLVGAILTPGQRTVEAALRVMRLSDDGSCARYHEVLNRVVWSHREVARVLLLLQHCPASTILADLSSISFAGSPPRPGQRWLRPGQRWLRPRQSRRVGGLHRSGSWGRQTPG